MQSFQDPALGDLVGLPSTWRLYLISLGATPALVGLDFAGAIFAKEWAERQHTAFFLAGLFTFGLLFTVYAPRGPRPENIEGLNAFEVRIIPLTFLLVSLVLFFVFLTALHQYESTRDE